MTEDLLRRWVRSELPPAERRVVSRWIVQCSSPDLGPLLHGMLREERDRVADAALLRRGTVWSRLVDGWNTLLESGRAVLSGGDDVVLATTDVDAPSLTITEVEGRVIAEVRAVAALTGLYLTDDTGRVALLAPGPPVGAVVRAELPADLRDRSTVWAVWGPLRSNPDPEAALADALEDPAVTVSAVRWTPPT